MTRFSPPLEFRRAFFEEGGYSFFALFAQYQAGLDGFFAAERCFEDVRFVDEFFYFGERERRHGGEARGEPYVGMVAVGAVALNRVRSSRFPNTLAGVIYQSGAFDAVSDGQINLAPSEQSRRAARDALNGWDPTSGCLYYYNPATATSPWIWSREVRLTIGDHSFAV